LVGGVAVLVAASVLVLVHLGFRAPRVRERGSPADVGLAFETVWVPTVRGRRLFGWWLAAPAARGSVVVLHGWGSNAEQMLPIAAPLRRAGLSVLLIDARCHGRSDGDSFASLPRFAEDLGCAIAWLKRRPGVAADRIAVLGHSVGAGAVLLEATRNPAVSAVISVSAFADPAVVTERFLQHLRLPRWLVALVIAYTQWLIGYRFETIAPASTICRVPCPVLLVHGLDDDMVPVADARAIAYGCPVERVRLLEIADAGHASTHVVERHADELLAFLERVWSDRHAAAAAGGDGA
jgi:pimeloyl-ACP methyl ester carboxylesterase